MSSISTSATDSPAHPQSLRRRVTRILLPLAVPGLLLALYAFLIAPLQRTLWIINHIEQAGMYSSVRTTPAGPQWLRDAMHDSFAQGLVDVTQLNLAVDSDAFDTARLLTCLATHSHVASLGLKTRRAYDDEFGRLDCLPHLTALDLSGGILTDEGMQHLQRCQALTTLSLKELHITDDGMQHLQRCQALTRLSLRRLDITDDGIAPIGSLARLEELDIRGCPRITDEALRSVSSAGGIRKLRVSAPGITDKSLQFLAGMKSLELLDVSDTGITTEGALLFDKARPRCTIIWTEGGTMHSNHLVGGLGG